MKRMLCAILGIASIAAAADAATLGVVSDKSWYYFGETVTLTVVGDDQGATSYGIFGRLVYNGLTLDNVTRQQTQLVGPYGKWTLGALDASDTNVNSPTSAYVDAFNQLSGLQQSANNLPGVLATLTFTANNYGVPVNVTWDTTTFGYELDFFGLTNAPGTSFYVIPCDGCPPVPEPSTGALLGLGLLALASMRRST